VDRVALISDIHGNMTALDAVFDDIAERGIQRIICLGDLVGKGPKSDVAVDVCRERCEIVIRGNWDDFIGNPTERTSMRWYQEQLGGERLGYLGSLPLSLDLVVSGRHVRLFHASQESVHVRVLMSSPRERHLEMFDSSELTGPGPMPDVVGYGDIHRAYSMSYGHRTLFNVGSVGNPLDATTAAYAIMEGNIGGAEPAGFSIQLARVPYDTDVELASARRSDMPHYEAYEHELTRGEYAGAMRAD
jgi:predicted phosphodiesterase